MADKLCEAHGAPMDRAKILIQLDTDAQPSVFDSVVAIDSGVGQLLRHAGVTADNVEPLVHGAIFTRGPDDLRRTAIFVGGSDVGAAEAVLGRVKATFFGPMRVSVLLDPGGANTTAAAAVLAAARHVQLAGATALVLGGTGPVGQRAARLLARAGAAVRVGSRSAARAQAVCDAVAQNVADAKLMACGTATPSQTAAALEGAEVLIAAGAAGAALVSKQVVDRCEQLRVAIDLNAVPPEGIEGVEVTDRARQRGQLLVYGAIGVGNVKMKIHKAAVQMLFEANDRILDAEELYELGRGF